MSNIPISSLPLAISLDGSEEVPIVQGGTTKRTTTSAIGGQATGFVPTTRSVNAGVGLSGGGQLTTDVTLNLDIADLTTTPAMAIADSFAINSVSSGNQPLQVTFPNAMKAIAGLTTLSIPSLTNDFLVINRGADGLTYKISPSSLSLAAGNVPAGGTTGQFLAKASNTDYDTIWANSAILLDAVSVAGNPTNASAFSTSVTGTANQVLRIAASGTSLGFGSIDLSTTAAVGSSVLGAANGGTGLASYAVGDLIYASGATTLARLADIATGNALLSGGVGAAPTWGKIDLTTTVAGILPSANGGTGVNNGASTLTLGGNLTTSGAFASTFTMTGATNVTFPTSGTLATTGGASIPSIAQGDLLYGSATNVLSALAKDTNATRYLSNTGSSNNPAWAQVNLTNGVSGQLALTNGGTAANLTASNGGLVYSTASALAILSGTATANQIPLSGSSAAPAWSTATYPATAAAGTLLAAATANTIAATATPTLGVNGGTGGQLTLNGSTSGSAAIRVAAAAGTGTIFQLPPDNGTNTYVLQTDGSGNTSWVASAGGGTVTSVSFTGGLISVATATTTPALTVAGTSGGVPYFSSASTWASSAALAASAVLIGGGAGNPPASTTTGTGVVAAIGQNVTGSGGFVLANTPTLVTPVLGAATGTSVTLTGAAPQVVLGANAATLGAVKMFGSTSGDATIQPAAIAGTATVLTLPSATGTLLSTAQTALITKGFTVTPNNIGTVSSGTTTPAAADGNYQYLTNNGAFTLAAPAADSAIDILITNGASAGTITFSGFTVGTNIGSPFTTTNTSKFLLSIRRINGVSTYSNYALQ